MSRPFPTRMALTNTKTQLKGAQTGHSLLAKKRDALMTRFRAILKKVDEAKRRMGRVLQLASFSLAEVTYATGDISYQVQESVRQASYTVVSKSENVSGVVLPTFEGVRKEGGNDFTMTGLGRGGQQVQKCRETYVKAVETLVELASLQTAFTILDEVIRATNRRVNAIEHIVIPRLEDTIAFITSELDEMDREDFFRLKKVQGKKKRVQAERDIADKEARRLEELELQRSADASFAAKESKKEASEANKAGITTEKDEGKAGGKEESEEEDEEEGEGNLLGGKDEDVIF